LSAPYFAAEKGSSGVSSGNRSTSAVSSITPRQGSGYTDNVETNTY
jgi:hypothetical protein